MLTGISPLISPDLLAVLCRMGHGDELVLADAHFPAESVNRRVLRADGLAVADLLDAVLPLFALDTYVADPVVMMAPVAGDTPDPTVHARYRAAIDRHHPNTAKTAFISRFDFYARAGKAFAVVVTGETAVFDTKSNLITMLGGIVLTQCKNVLRGDRLFVDMTTGVSRVESDSGKVQGLFIQSGQGCGPAAQGSGSPLPGFGAPNKPK